MSGINHRTVFAEIRKDPNNNFKKYFRFFDWAVVHTGIGSMLEPYLVQNRLDPAANTDTFPTATNFTDMMFMINTVEFANVDTFFNRMSKDGGYCHGGVQIPRTGG